MRHVSSIVQAPMRTLADCIPPSLLSLRRETRRAPDRLQETKQQDTYLPRFLGPLSVWAWLGVSNDVVCHECVCVCGWMRTPIYLPTYMCVCVCVCVCEIR
ncbi:hypothetical protein LX32DRAFT_376477 [Colletotrichum zoysiae]|uniref:Uncharacterized protein n=1 Tax=Colletotrichum zoysiae TaxID=1216348 RepID=A0AAD9HHS9_9PEZI|nr:hypothetical protein LX32DRAFT_376477 [Colletotrichum zoysiae]